MKNHNPLQQNQTKLPLPYLSDPSNSHIPPSYPYQTNKEQQTTKIDPKNSTTITIVGFNKQPNAKVKKVAKRTNPHHLQNHHNHQQAREKLKPYLIPSLSFQLIKKEETKLKELQKKKQKYKNSSSANNCDNNAKIKPSPSSVIYFQQNKSGTQISTKGCSSNQVEKYRTSVTEHELTYMKEKGKERAKCQQKMMERQMEIEKQGQRQQHNGPQPQQQHQQQYIHIRNKLHPQSNLSMVNKEVSRKNSSLKANNNNDLSDSQWKEMMRIAKQNQLVRFQMHGDDRNSGGNRGGESNGCRDGAKNEKNLIVLTEKEEVKGKKGRQETQQAITRVATRVGQLNQNQNQNKNQRAICVDSLVERIVQQQQQQSQINNCSGKSDQGKYMTDNDKRKDTKINFSIDIVKEKDKDIDKEYSCLNFKKMVSSSSFQQRQQQQQNMMMKNNRSAHHEEHEEELQEQKQYDQYQNQDQYQRILSKYHHSSTVGNRGGKNPEQEQEQEQEEKRQRSLPQQRCERGRFNLSTESIGIRNKTYKSSNSLKLRERQKALEPIMCSKIKGDKWVSASINSQNIGYHGHSYESAQSAELNPNNDNVNGNKEMETSPSSSKILFFKRKRKSQLKNASKSVMVQRIIDLKKHFNNDSNSHLKKRHHQKDCGNKSNPHSLVIQQEEEQSYHGHQIQKGKGSSQQHQNESAKNLKFQQTKSNKMLTSASDINSLNKTDIALLLTIKANEERAKEHYKRMVVGKSHNDGVGGKWDRLRISEILEQQQSQQGQRNQKHGLNGQNNINTYTDGIMKQFNPEEGDQGRNNDDSDDIDDSEQQFSEQFSEQHLRSMQAQKHSSNKNQFNYACAERRIQEQMLLGNGNKISTYNLNYELAEKAYHQKQQVKEIRTKYLHTKIMNFQLNKQKELGFASTLLHCKGGSTTATNGAANISANTSKKNSAVISCIEEQNIINSNNNSHDNRSNNHLIKLKRFISNESIIYDDFLEIQKKEPMKMTKSPKKVHQNLYKIAANIQRKVQSKTDNHKSKSSSVEDNGSEITFKKRQESNSLNNQQFLKSFIRFQTLDPWEIEEVQNVEEEGGLFQKIEQRSEL